MGGDGSGSGPAAVGAFVAKRRPGWDLAQLHGGLQLDPFHPLEEAEGTRQICPKCSRSRGVYCYDCLLAFTETPKLSLPFKVYIVGNEAEKQAKNTGVQAALIAPEHVELHSFERMPELDNRRTAILYPSDDACKAEDLDPASVDTMIILDTTWQKAHALVKSTELAGIRRVSINNQQTAFWRHHTKETPTGGLSSVESLYFLLKALAVKTEDPHKYDNILWYFSHQYQVVARHVEERKKSYQHKKHGSEAEDSSRRKKRKKGHQVVADEPK